MILFYSEEITPRLEYIARLIFGQILRIDFSFSTVSSEFRGSNLPKINYSDIKFEDEIYLKPNGLLFQKGLKPVENEPVEYYSTTCFFKSPPGSVFPFDLFAAAFFLVTRYEEYFETEFDKYSRFRAERSILSKYGLLKKPVINIWAGWLAEELKKKFPELVFPERKFEFISTIDIDNAWAYLNKGIKRTGGVLLQSLAKGNFTEFISRLKVVTGKETDPYDTYVYLDSVFSGNEKKVKFFFLLGDYSQFDKNVSHKNSNFHKLIQRISENYETGIHPSFSAFLLGGVEVVILEKRRLEKITGKKISKSRQHYLNLKFPDTYRNLIEAGITEDYTMGFAHETGFRAGVCTPFYFYDLEKEAATNLLVVPFQVMDGTLLHYLKLAPDEAFEEIKKIMMEVKNAGGTFVTIWHNETVNDLGEWKGFREVFEKTTRLGFEWAND